MRHEELFNYYQNKLAWVDRMTNPKTLEYTGESKDNWKHAKEIIFDWYQDMRYYCEDSYPTFESCLFYDYDLVKDEKAYVFENGYVCEPVGILKYRDNEYILYNDENGMSSFIVIKDANDEDYAIQVDSFEGGTDWWYELDKFIDKIYK